MVVYIEYAFIWNFLLDGVLLYLSLRAAKTKVRWAKLLFAALFGAVFAIVFPLVKLPDLLSYFLKFAVGFLLCLIVSPRLKNKKEWGRYAFICIFFFCFSFAFAGAIIGLLGNEPKKGAILFAVALLTAFSLFLIKKFYEKRAVEKCVYDCAILYKQRRVAAFGFYDSGNLAERCGAPVCFVSPDLFYDVFGDELAFGEAEQGGQVCDEMQIQTLGGTKIMRLYKAELQIRTKEGVFTVKQVYFSPSANMLSREYKLLLNSRIFEKGQER